MKKFLVLLSAVCAFTSMAAYLDIAPTEFRHYKVNEKVTFKVAAYESKGKLLKSGKFELAVKDSGKNKIMKNIVVDLSKQNDFTFTTSLARPGFILVSAGTLTLDNGKKVKWARKPYSSYGGAAVEPEKIPPAAERPADFDKFWADGLEEFKKAEVIVTPAPDMKRPGYDVSGITVKFPENRGAIYGYISIPSDRSKKYPAQIGVPGAGPGTVRATPSYRGNAPAIEVWMNVHKFPIAKTSAEQKKRLNEYNDALPEKAYARSNSSDRNKYFFRDVWLALSKAIDYVVALKEFDGKNFAAIGSSQGGGTAIALAYLNKNISCLFANVPALCDHSGWKADRADGWPAMHQAMRGKADKVMPYFDGVNFAGKITVPALITVGFVDTTCPPAGVYAMYNQLAGKKIMHDMPRLGHAVPAEMKNLIVNFYKTEFK